MSGLSFVCCFVVFVHLGSTAAAVSHEIHVAGRSVSSFDNEQNERLAALEAIASKLTHIQRVCPADFVFVPSVNGCYKVLLKNLDWVSAGLECRSLHKDAHLVIIDNVAEQHAINNMMAHHHNDISLRMCSKPCWDTVSIWTAAQQFDPSAKTEFVWKVLSADAMKMHVSHIAYYNWVSGQPNEPYQACVHLARGNNYQWVDSSCLTQICSLCEIDLV